MKKTFGKILKNWRTHERYSQLQLALELDISSKHISFLETGRSSPSQSMILKLSEFLNISKKETNDALVSAGFAPKYSEYSPLNEADYKPIKTAIDKMIMNHMPYPAMVLNQEWDIINANPAAIHLMTKMGFGGSHNLIEALLLDTPEQSNINNWHQAIAEFIKRLKTETRQIACSERLITLTDKLSAHLKKYTSEPYDDSTDSLVLATQLDVDGQQHTYFSVIAQLGSVQDIVMSEYRIELMFPNDAITSEYYENLGS